tara:strand:- start:1917 stop:2486 length:570 start_codon:yes stop_codon:yes gene_type:complete
MYIILPLQNIKIVDFSAIITNNVEINLINDIDSYGLIKEDEINIKNKDVKRLLYHHIIYGLCQYVLNVKSKEKLIIHYCTLITPTRHLSKYIDTETIQTFFNNFTVKLRKMLPIKFLILEQSFNNIKHEIEHGNGGKADIVTQAKCAVDSFDVSKFTFTKARYFANRYKLNYLSNNYFKKVRNKQLILS